MVGLGGGQLVCGLCLLVVELLLGGLELGLGLLGLGHEVCVVLVESVEGVPHRSEVVEGAHAQQDVEI